MSRDDVFLQAHGLFRAGRVDEAVGLLRQLHAADPGDRAVLRALATFLTNSGDYAAAVPYLRDDIRLGATLDAVKMLGAVFVHLGDAQELSVLAKAVHDLIWDEAEVVQAWGFALWRRQREFDALPLLERAVALEPENPTYRHNLSAALIDAGRGEEAVVSFSSRVSPWTGGDTGPDVAAEYKAVSQGYDDKEIHHSFTQSLLRCYSEAAPARRLRSVLDLGCGTGLLAAKLPASATSVWGIDLSPDMLVAARAGGIYDTLLEGDLVAVMAGLSQTFDTVLAACVLYHMADLRPVFTNVARILNPGGIFAFSVDPLTDDRDIGVTGPGEYCHSRAYLRRLAAEAGLDERLIGIDKHRGPPGFFCVFRKT